MVRELFGEAKPTLHCDLRGTDDANTTAGEGTVNAAGTEAEGAFEADGLQPPVRDKPLSWRWLNLLSAASLRSER